MIENGQRPTGLHPVEILHIDTSGSHAFFKALDVSPQERGDCQKILADMFLQCCQQYNGYVAANWAGDGGHAFFVASEKSGNSIAAGKEFIYKLPVLAQQTATAVGRRATPDIARRQFRIKAHFGNVLLTADGKCDAGHANDFDSFLKNERELAPVPDELFITEQLRAQLGGPEKSLFREHRSAASYGSLTTALYRMKAQPNNRARKILEEGGQRPSDITDNEWQFLRLHILSQRMNVIARNSITKGLIKATNGSALDHAVMLDLTVRALYNYLRSAYRLYQFRIAVWRPVDALGGAVLEKVAFYPTNITSKPRSIPLDIRYQVVRTFVTNTSLVTQCVSESRIDGEWSDFDDSQSAKARGLQSTIQIPIYLIKQQVNDFEMRETVGVLSVDCDKPDFFLKEEVDLWTDDLVGFLANLAFSEHMRRTTLAPITHGTKP